MFVQSEKFVQAHGGRINDISIYGQESNATTWRLCRMNLAIRAIEANIGPYHADSFHNDLHKDLKADFVLANPQQDVRWKYGTPPPGNANFAWAQHFISAAILLPLLRAGREFFVCLADLLTFVSRNTIMNVRQISWKNYQAG